MTQLQHSAGPGHTAGQHQGGQRLSWHWLLWSAAAGVAVGVFWWILAPAGFNLLTRDPALATGMDTAAWLPRDLTLAGLFLFTGCLSGFLLAGRILEFTGLKFACALAGGLLGAIIAWRTGMLVAGWWGEPVDATANASIAFSLRSLPVLLIWPAATAAATFSASVYSLSGRQAAGKRRRHRAVTGWPRRYRTTQPVRVRKIDG